MNVPDGIGRIVRLKDRRVALYRLDGHLVIRCKRLEGKRRVVVTDMALSDEAMDALISCYISLVQLSNERDEGDRSGGEE